MTSQVIWTTSALRKSRQAELNIKNREQNTEEKPVQNLEKKRGLKGESNIWAVFPQTLFTDSKGGG